ncbi:helix-turn-helix domain-containing protein [Cohaesibacter gelatinilyticus]|uniref:Helix-turn-helix domain-containing protein n=1 Tax=Cohaesibacter gelatinilyticus TaxID=372072 RepID=A0A285PGS6_9HYPH|nr:helix-turn-helix transcriptional regulator [Cohaesibacter gelatinilyticus]SNZ20925.1 Helix-turn-helix domain-containing protein [Cohaesibacter gelatinilyticus]
MLKKYNSENPNPNDIKLGARLKLARSLAGMSQEKLGSELKITFQQIQKYEKGTNRISASRLIDCARILNQPITFFYEIEEEAKSEQSQSWLDVVQSDHGLRVMKILGNASEAQKDKILRTARIIAEPG